MDERDPVEAVSDLEIPSLMRDLKASEDRAKALAVSTRGSPEFQLYAEQIYHSMLLDRYRVVHLRDLADDMRVLQQAWARDRAKREPWE